MIVYIKANLRHCLCDSLTMSHYSSLHKNWILGASEKIRTEWKIYLSICLGFARHIHSKMLLSKSQMELQTAATFVLICEAKCSTQNYYFGGMFMSIVYSVPIICQYCLAVLTQCPTNA